MRCGIVGGRAVDRKIKFEVVVPTPPILQTDSVAPGVWWLTIATFRSTASNRPRAVQMCRGDMHWLHCNDDDLGDY